MANQDFLEDWAVGRVMGRKMMMGWAGGQAQLGGGGIFCVLQTQFSNCFVFCLLMLPIIILLPLSYCSIYNKCDIHKNSKCR